MLRVQHFCIAFVIFSSVSADLPLHCPERELVHTFRGQPTDDVATWTVHRTVAVPPTETLRRHDEHGNPETLVPQFEGPGSDWSKDKFCGLSTPNSNAENVKFATHGGGVLVDHE